MNTKFYVIIFENDPLYYQDDPLYKGTDKFLKNCGIEITGAKITFRSFLEIVTCCYAEDAIKFNSIKSAKGALDAIRGIKFDGQLKPRIAKVVIRVTVLPFEH